MSEANQIELAVIVAATVSGALGIVVGYYLETWADALWRAVMRWRDRQDRQMLSRRIREVWELSERQASLAVAAHERWTEGLCPFCGYDHQDGERRRCEAQVGYVRSTGRATWEEGRIDPILDHVFGEDRQLEVAG